MVQSCPDASPMKWHQAHTTWFFETFVLRPFLPDYKPFREEFRWLFNSYYNSIGEAASGKAVARFVFAPVARWRCSPFANMWTMRWKSSSLAAFHDDAARRIMLGLNHEQQHQELMLTDIKHAFFSNPLRPAYDATPFAGARDVSPSDFMWHRFHDGVTEIGYPIDSTNCLDFCFDNETPRHKVYLEAFGIANRGVTCREYLEFMSDDGIRAPRVLAFRGLGSGEETGMAGATLLGARRRGQHWLAHLHPSRLASAFRVA